MFKGPLKPQGLHYTSINLEPLFVFLVSALLPLAGENNLMMLHHLIHRLLLHLALPECGINGLSGLS